MRASRLPTSSLTPVLVTGASGFIGSNVVRRLVETGRFVRCLVRATSRADRLDGLDVERVTGDIRDSQAVHFAAEGCGAIVHLAGLSAWSQIDSPLMFPVVVDGTRNVLEAATAQGVRRIVYVSSAAALGPSRNTAWRDETAPFDERGARGMAYVRAKRAAEELCRDAVQTGLQVVIVNPAEVYGPGDRDLVTAGNLLGLLNSRPIVVCRGGTGLVHVDDAAEGIVRALERGRSGESYLLAGGNLHHSDLARLLVEIAGLRTPVVTVPAAVLRAASAVAAGLRLPFPIPHAVVPYATQFWFVDSGKARRELDLEFRSPRDTLAETLSWLRDAGHLPCRGNVTDCSRSLRPLTE